MREEATRDEWSWRREGNRKQSKQPNDDELSIGDSDSIDFSLPFSPFVLCIHPASPAHCSSFHFSSVRLSAPSALPVHAVSVASAPSALFMSCSVGERANALGCNEHSSTRRKKRGGEE